MARTTLYASIKANLKVGTIGPVERAVPDGVSRLILTASRDNWTDIAGDVVSVMVDLSLDNGATWISPYAGFTARGGVILNKDGTTKGFSVIDVPLLPGVNRVVRLTVQVMTAIKAAFTIEVQ